MTWWWVANAVLFLVVIPTVVVLAQRMLNRTRRVEREARTILAHTAGMHFGER